MKSAARWMSTREQQLVKQGVAVTRNVHNLAFGKVFETSLTFWGSMNYFSVRFAILLTLGHTYCCTWPTATPTNSNAHVSPVGSKVTRCARGIHCENVHLAHSHCVEVKYQMRNKKSTNWGFTAGLV